MERCPPLVAKVMVQMTAVVSLLELTPLYSYTERKGKQGRISHTLPAEMLVQQALSAKI